MSTLKQDVIEWALSLPEDCAPEEVRLRLEALLRRDQEARERGPMDQGAVPPARLEAVGQELARQGFHAKRAALQAYLSKRGRD
jgi:hypothetical protein